MIPFDYERATDVDGAVATVTADPDARFLAGGTNLVDHMKLGVAQPGRTRPLRVSDAVEGTAVRRVGSAP
jgi:CO/xanthine dehydrogenase FAD-binding subunit